MAEKTLIAKVQADGAEDGTLIIASPVVGLADGAPKSNAYLNPLDSIVTIRVLGQHYVLRLPRDHQGRLTEVFIPNELTPVGFNQPLARLNPRALEVAGQQEGPASGGLAASGDDGKGRITIKSPTEGIFYRRPSPGTPAYVEVGAEISAGTVLGLVEVMKCFNQITYGGAGLPTKGRLVQILAEDAEEVRFGQALFGIEPVS